MLLFLLSACNNNSDSPADVADSVFIAIDTVRFLPCTRSYGAYIPEADSVGQEGVLQLGRITLIQKNIGLKEYPIGDYNMFNFSMKLDGRTVWTFDSTLRAELPRITADSVWLTLQLATYPSETYSKTAFYLYNIPRQQLTQIDSAMFTMVEPAVVTIDGKTYVLYVDGECLYCFDVENHRREELAWLTFKGFADDYLVCVDKVYDVVLQNGKLTGKMQLNMNVRDTENEARCGSFSIDWQPNTKK